MHALDLVRVVPDFPEPGVRFRDMSPLLADGRAFAEVTSALAAFVPDGTSVLAAVESRGFLFAAAVAAVRGIGVVMVRKPGKLPLVADRASYSLEYGSATLELPVDVLRAGQRVVVLDDVLATGGTLDAACALVERAGASVEAVLVVLELTALAGRARLSGRPVHALGAV